ncbi:Zinc-type alcohol dehydrogenase-like protein [Lachnellula suecica]|uniref:Zinc-type alcohol dehydrogenase-like protein n=1 Tax=Lachnellula suecica TaxID=602035 RepID=A0A8T9C2Y9_9HELO|nr:Zinc-type alcohol dehydrogenase-like protein [Lachnellula suecica]
MALNTVFRIHKEGSSQSLTTAKEPIPVIDKHEVLIKIRAVALNFRDIAILAEQYPLEVKENVIPCSDAAGEVVEVGSLIQDLKVGDRVIGSFAPAHLYGPALDSYLAHGAPIDGVLREYISLPGTAVTKFPSDSKLSFPQMSALVCTGVTAWNALYGNVPLKPGQTVLFQGTGGVSITGLMLAKAAGAVTIITSSSDEKLELVQKNFGADHLINYKKTPDWAAEANKITNGLGVDYIFENGGAGTIEQSLSCIARGGIISAIGFLAPGKKGDDFDVTLGALTRGCIIRGILVGSKQLLDELVRFVINKGLVPPVEKTFGFSLEEVKAAYAYLQSGSHIGKVCITLD